MSSACAESSRRSISRAEKFWWRAYQQRVRRRRAHRTGLQAVLRKDHGKDLGITTWTPGQWKMGGGTIWGWISYDPELNLIYYGTGNPGVWNPDMRPGDNKWSITIWARDPETGEAKWAYQVEPHDASITTRSWKTFWSTCRGRARYVIFCFPGRTGFMFVLDRETGEVLSAEKFEPVNWANGYNLKTGLPDKDRRSRRIREVL